MPVDLTSPWIPLSLIMMLGVFMIRQFMQERREARELAFAESGAPAAAASVPSTAEPAAPVTTSETPQKEQKKKRKLRWRTAWIWMPFLIGFFGQAYLSFIKPLMEGAGQ